MEILMFLPIYLALVILVGIWHICAKLISIIKEYFYYRDILKNSINKITNVNLEIYNKLEDAYRHAFKEYYAQKIILKDQNGVVINICPKCNNYLRIIHGRRGKFWGCTNFPRCRYTKDFEKEISLEV